jgi:predicted nucleotidyltransferase
VDLTAHWVQLQEFCEVAAGCAGLQVWLFGSALDSPNPTDLDVLVIYEDRISVVRLKAARRWGDFDPPLHIIAMTAEEEEFYDFKAVTGAARIL